MKDVDPVQVIAAIRDAVNNTCATCDPDEACAYLEFTLSHIVPLLRRLAGESKLPDLSGSQIEERYSGWDFLAKRQHPWKKQLFVLGRNMTAAQVAKTADDHRMSNEEAGKHFGLNDRAIAEAREYAKHYATLIRYEALVDWLMLDVYRGENPLGGNDA